MKYQSRKYSCGPAALANALEALGIRRSESELAELCKTTVEGTSEMGLRRALLTLNIQFQALSERRFDVARLRLFECLYKQGSAVLCVANSSHWVSIVGVSGKRFIVVDSAVDDLLLFWSVEELENEWTSNSNYYGLLIYG